VKLGVLMTSLALIWRSPAEGSLAIQIRTFIAQYLKVDTDSIEAHSSLTDDFGLDLFDITELTIVLEQQFCAQGEIMDDPSQIEFVDDLICHIEQHRGL
jgi:acyl carrier protein